MKLSSKIVLWSLIGASLILGLRYCYYGSLFRSCIYTEEVQPLAAGFAGAKVRLIRSAAILKGQDKAYQCLKELGQITNKIVEAKSASHYRYQIESMQTQIVDAESEIEFEVVKMIAVTKHGISTIDSGSGPIKHLILKDLKGNLYEVATVSLGLNSGDEFLQAIIHDQKVILNPETEFLE